jgi:hypothetical protein
MRAYLLLKEVQDFVNFSLENFKSQKKHYDYKDIAKLEEKVSKKYSDAYARRAFSSRSMDGRRFTALYKNYVALHYLKLTMEVNGYNHTSELGPHIDLKDTSLKILERIDKLGYETYQKNQRKANI